MVDRKATLKRRSLPISLIFALFLLITLSCAYMKVQDQPRIPDTHPAELEKGRVVCTECHDEPLKGTMNAADGFNHTATFIQFHREYASSEGKLCMSCHHESFCADCHTSKDELKPGTKHGDRADRIFPHRGDYLTKHKIDGKLMPEECFKCHGRQNNATCLKCHKS